VGFDWSINAKTSKRFRRSSGKNYISNKLIFSISAVGEHEEPISLLLRKNPDEAEKESDV
jgi:hypothetical protein